MWERYSVSMSALGCVSVARTTRRKLHSTVRLDVAAAQEWRCSMCHKMLSATFEVDHITPLHDGGEDVRTNLQALCPDCHRRKTAAEMERMHRRNAEVQPVPVIHCMVCGKCFSPYFGHVH